MIVTWTKPDGGIEVDKAEALVTWFSVVSPQFDIVYNPSPVLVSSTTNTVFTIFARNFDDSTFRFYSTSWTIDPPLSNPQGSRALSYGKLLQVLSGNWQKNTNYTITANMVYKALPELTGQKTITFLTKSPPTGGSVQIQPGYGVIGSPFTVVLKNWSSENPPIVYDVF